uniref:Integrase catalytic domain-containing protein n=1 Tax=Nicotiana tabacum TaxID=4097 RepID=A0A1S3ZKS0_TOBAC|nr:PREDICTED: uncharacterized protein LOC107787745 [Nicotiana tabacum]
MAGTAFSAHIKDLVTEVLHQTNYLKWVHLIQLVIEMYDLFGHIDGSESHPPEFNVSSDVADAWITLKNYFFHQSTAREMQYKHQLHTIKKEDLSTDAYMSKIQELADCLHSIGRCVNDSELACTLPSPNLVSPTTSLVTTIADPLSSTSSGYHGRGHGRGRGRGGGRRHAQDYDRGIISQFHYTPSPTPVSRGGPFQHSTSGRGVLAPSPYHLPAFVAPTPTFTTVICQICDLSGHTAFACPQHHNHAYTAPSLQANMPALSLQSPPDKNWYLYSGATAHMTNNLGNLSSFSPVSNDSILVGNGTCIPVTGIGSSSLSTPSCSFTLSPDLSTGKVLHHSHTDRPLYPFQSSSALSSSAQPSTFVALHDSSSICSKHSALPFSLSTSTTSYILELVHSDVWKSPVPSVSGYHYYVLYIDDFTRYTWIYPLRHKSDAISCFTHFKLLVENQFGGSIKTFRSDGEGEYQSSSFISFLRSHNIHHQLSCAHTPQQNGVAERKHCHITNVARTILFHAHAPLSLWVEAFLTAVHLINRLPSSSLAKLSLYENLFGVPPDYTILKPFGCLCYPNLRPYHSHKLDSSSSPCIFLGYNSSHKEYRCLRLDTNRVYISRSVRFIEHCFPYANLSAFLPPRPSMPHVLLPIPAALPSPTPTAPESTSSATTFMSPSSSVESPSLSSLPPSSLESLSLPLSSNDSCPIFTSTIEPLTSISNSAHPMIT